LRIEGAAVDRPYQDITIASSLPLLAMTWENVETDLTVSNRFKNLSLHYSPVKGKRKYALLYGV
jgi:hypothetical protein